MEVTSRLPVTESRLLPADLALEAQERPSFAGAELLLPQVIWVTDHALHHEQHVDMIDTNYNLHQQAPSTLIWYCASAQLFSKSVLGGQGSQE